MSRKVGYTADGVALDLDVGAEHLADERFETAKLDDEQLVVSCTVKVIARAFECRMCTYYSLTSYPMTHWQLVGPRYHDCRAGRGWGQECPVQRGGPPSQ